MLAGDPADGEGFCFLFGQTLPFGDGVLESLYGSLDDWTTAAQASADTALEAGWLLPEDAASMLEEGMSSPRRSASVDRNRQLPPQAVA